MTTIHSEKEDATVYNVVVNDEEQYSIWPGDKEIPSGWKHTGKSGLKAECLAHIKEAWTDMRPLSLRKKMEEWARTPDSAGGQPNSSEPEEKSLVDHLCEGDHLIEAALRPEKTVKRFKEALDRNYVHIRFTQTRGATEVGFRLDRDASDFSKADFDSGKGTVSIQGSLILDYVRVKCIAAIDLSTLQGKGRLVKAEAGERSAAS